MSDLSFRPFDKTRDYPASVAVYNSVHAQPLSVAAARDHNARFEADCRTHKVAELGGELVAEYAVLKAPLGENQLKLTLTLHADHATPGRRQQLYDAAHAEVVRFAPSGLLVTVSEEQRDWLELYEREGFKELERMWTSHLNPQTFDPAQFAASFKASGIRFGTVADLPDNEATQRFLYDNIARQLLPAVPFGEALNIYPFELWQERVWGNKHRNPASAFIAWDGEELAGYSELYRTDTPHKLRTGLTAVKPDYQRRGIAMSLKLLAVDYAKTYGVTTISTSNHSLNRPMLAINEALGFVKDTVWITLKKTL